MAAPALDGSVAPTLEDFRTLARTHRVIPVVRRLLADGLTPVGLYRALAREEQGTFLLESAEHGRSWSRWSFVGASSSAWLTERDGKAVWEGKFPVSVPTEGTPLEVLRETVERLHSDRIEGLPPLTGGMVGFISYDAVRRLERLPSLNPDELGIPELSMLLATDLAALDHSDGSVWLIANAVNWDGSDERVDEAYADCVARLDAMASKLAAGVPSPTARIDVNAQATYSRRSSSEEYQGAVEVAKEQIRAGEAFQIVVSQRFERETAASALDIYRVLRATNPSPYMYLLRLNGVDVVGSSPEALVTVNQGVAVMHPIAGTMPRSADPEEDHRLAEKLLGDEKERAEHLMLVDLGRNDLGRVCAPGTVEVVDFMRVERYSHVMHLVSDVVGRLGEGKTAFDALAATFPAGTLSGAPKPRAMEIIEEVEPARRGLYGGVVGYLDFAGDSDTAIAIRTAVLTNGKAYVQAGAGIVADSNPELEDQESQNKAMAVLRAIAIAETMGSPSA